MLRKLFISLFFIFLSSISVMAQSPSVFRIGILDQERGRISNGARLAAQAINQQGGVLGIDGTRFQLELVIAPTNGGAQTSTALEALAQANVIAVIGPETSEEVLNSLPLLQSLGVPVLTPATGDSIIVSDATQALLRVRAPEFLQARALADYLINDVGTARLATVQLDVAATANVLAFETAARSLGRPPEQAIVVTNTEQFPENVSALIQSDPDIIVAYGAPASTGNFYLQLRQEGYTGLFAYGQLNDETFQEIVPLDQLNGILSSRTWPFTATDDRSTAFLSDYVRTFASIPGPIEAASYDAVLLLEAAIGQAGELRDNLLTLDNVLGVQGVLTPARLNPGETSHNVAVVRLGQFGAPQVVARYAGSERLPANQPAAALQTPTPAATNTPDFVEITVQSARQNVRTGPSTDYDILGQLSEGDRARVIGATADNAWVIIDYRGQQGWLATFLLDVFGDLNTVPIVQPPPTPTPGPTSTPAPPQEADIVIQSATVSPSPIVPGTPFNVSVTVSNVGLSPAGEFAIAATFPPNDVFTADSISGLAPGESTTANLNGTLNNTGFYSVVVVADLNNQVAEGPGEDNNTAYSFNYTVDRLIQKRNVVTLGPGQSEELDGEGGTLDVTWEGSSLNGVAGVQLGVIPGISFDTAHYDLINTGVVNSSDVSNLSTGVIVGVITSEGNRSVIRIDNIDGDTASLTYRTYND